MLTQLHSLRSLLASCSAGGSSFQASSSIHTHWALRLASIQPIAALGQRTAHVAPVAYAVSVAIMAINRQRAVSGVSYAWPADE